jgi:hypothetical protein
VVDLDSRGVVGDMEGIGFLLASSYANGYAGVKGPGSYQGEGVVLDNAHVTFVELGFPKVLDVEGVLFPVGGHLPLGPPFPGNVSVAVGANCSFGGHSGRGWSFLPWPAESVLDPVVGDQLLETDRVGIERGFHAIRQAFIENVSQESYRLVLFHRDGRYDLVSGSTVWWDEILDYQVRGNRPASLRVRLPGHRRRRSFGVDR